MHLRRVLASGLAACALFGVGAVVAPVAQAAPISCHKAHQIAERTIQLIDRKRRDAGRHSGQGQHALAKRELFVADHYTDRLKDMPRQYPRCGLPIVQTDSLSFEISTTVYVPARR